MEGIEEQGRNGHVLRLCFKAKEEFTDLLYVKLNVSHVMQATVIVGGPGALSFIGNLFYYTVNGNSAVKSGDSSNFIVSIFNTNFYEGMPLFEARASYLK